MLVLGVAGAFSLPYEKLYDVDTQLFHNSAAVLVDNGRIVAAIEEERLNRVKNTNKAALCAIKYCLESYGVGLEQIDKFALNFEENTFNTLLKRVYRTNIEEKEFKDARQLFQRMINQVFGKNVPDEKICFVNHHLTHAESAFAMSGFDRSLVLVIDSWGDFASGMIQSREGETVNTLFKIPEYCSLGAFYLRVIGHLAYSFADEYKVMGLAPYGDPGKYRSAFGKLYQLLPNGQYVLRMDLIDSTLYGLCMPRRKGEPFTQVHKDIAAALQETLEEIVFHVLKHYKAITGHTKLCLAGGVAHNCSMTGKLLYSGIFEDIFVQPAAHDAGCAIGAALHLSSKEGSGAAAEPLKHVYWGTDIGGNDKILGTLTRWKDFISFEKKEDIIGYAAKTLAEGSVIGWVQGRSEFGPRALGNRSILADPRPAQNKDIINAMIKKREAYRPFAPSVLEEYLNDYYEAPKGKKQFPFMNFVLRVKEDKQSLLGAVTHIDGTARVQSVSRETNSKYWELIREFGKLTGVPILLNTSFNNNAEPIVDSVEDAIICYLTTKLDYLVVGDYFITRKAAVDTEYLSLIPSIPLHMQLHQTIKYVSYTDIDEICTIEASYNFKYSTQVSPDTYKLLSKADGNKSLGDLLKVTGLFDSKAQLIEEILKLWSARMVILKP